MSGRDWKVRIHYRPHYPLNPFVVERVVWVEGGGTDKQAVAIAQQETGLSWPIARVEVEEAP